MRQNTKALRIETASGSEYLFNIEHKTWIRHGSEDKHFLRGPNGTFDEFLIKPTVGLQLHFAGWYEKYPEDPKRTYMKSTQPITRIEEIE